MLADGHRITFGLAALARDDAPEDRPRLIGWATLAALLLLIGLACAVVRRLLRPLADIGSSAMRYGRGDLAEQINRMADGLQHRLDAELGLLLAISHELRSPLTRARLNAELVAEGPERDALLRDLAQMRDLVIDLLESERLAGGHAVLSTEPSDLDALVDEVLAGQLSAEASANSNASALRFEAGDSLPLLALDRIRIRLLLRNLFDNALRHTPEAAEAAEADMAPVVTTRREGDAVRLTVRDHGPGVAEVNLDQLAQPFYRKDTARHRRRGPGLVPVPAGGCGARRDADVPRRDAEAGGQRAPADVGNGAAATGSATCRLSPFPNFEVQPASSRRACSGSGSGSCRAPCDPARSRTTRGSRSRAGSSSPRHTT